MPTNYPNSKDAFTIHTDNNQEAISAGDMNNVQDAISALEVTVGYDGTQPTSDAVASSIVKRDASGVSNVNALGVAGLTGATAASRYVGATTSGAPTTGTFAVGDFVIDQIGALWICITAGTPGAWNRVMTTGDVNARSDMFAVANANQSFSANTWTTVNFQSVTNDNLGEYDSATSIFTAKNKGIYTASAGLQFVNLPTTGPTRMAFELYVNSASALRLYDNTVTPLSTSNAVMLQGASKIRLNANDKINVAAFATSSVTSNYTADTCYLAITQIG